MRMKLVKYFKEKKFADNFLSGEFRMGHYIQYWSEEENKNDPNEGKLNTIHRGINYSSEVSQQIYILCSSKVSQLSPSNSSKHGGYGVEFCLKDMKELLTNFISENDVKASFNHGDINYEDNPTNNKQVSDIMLTKAEKYSEEKEYRFYLCFSPNLPSIDINLGPELFFDPSACTEDFCFNVPYTTDNTRRVVAKPILIKSTRGLNGVRLY